LWINSTVQNAIAKILTKLFVQEPKPNYSNSNCRL